MRLKELRKNSYNIFKLPNKIQSKLTFRKRYCFGNLPYPILCCLQADFIAGGTCIIRGAERHTALSVRWGCKFFATRLIQQLKMGLVGCNLWYAQLANDLQRRDRGTTAVSAEKVRLPGGIAALTGSQPESVRKAITSTPVC